MSYKYTHWLSAAAAASRGWIMRGYWFFLAVILWLQWLMTSKFAMLFGTPTHATWERFIRNYHMAGFDPITYHVLLDWHQGYDVVRHPLLAWMMLPLSWLNTALTHMLGTNCVLYIEAALLTTCGYFSSVLIYRTIHRVIGTTPFVAWLLTALTLSFAYIMLATVVADHFCLSLLMLTLTLYRAGMKMRRGSKFGAAEAITLFTVTAGITLSNGIVVLMAVAIVNGRAAWRMPFVLRVMVLPLLMMLAVAFGGCRLARHAPLSPSAAMTQQTRWVGSDAPRAAVVVENMLGETVQLHRSHVLGDVLSGRPVIVPYTWKAQYAVEALLVALFIGGVFAGRRDPFVLLPMAVLALNVALHVVLGFALSEVHIMAAHWAFVMPMCMAWLFRLPDRRTRGVLTAVVAVLTVYLYAYNGLLIYRYLTWPLTA